VASRFKALVLRFVPALAVNIQDGGNTITVDGTVTVTATDLDIRNLAPATDTVAIGDGAATATIRNLAANDALNVAIVDGAGDQITSFGGGTQYTEDAAAAANPIGTALNLIRQDTPAGLTTTDGDNVAQRGTNFGAGFVQVLTSAGAFVDTFGGGTQYSDGDANADPTGTVAMGTDGSNIFALHTDTAGDLQVDILTIPTVTVQATDLDVRNLTNGDVVTAELSAVDNAVLDAVEADTTTLAGAVSGTEMQVDIISMPGVTETNSDAIKTSVELIDDAVYTDDTSTHATGTSKGLGIMAAATPTDSAVGANDIGMVAMTTDRKLHVSVQDALPAGDNNIGNVDILSIAAGDNNIGNVDIVTMPSVVIGSGTVTTVSTVTSLTQMNGQAISMGTGARDAGTQRVTIATNDAVPVTFTGSTDVATQTTLASLLTSSQLIDDTVQVLGTDTYTEGSSKGITLGAVRRDADTSLVNTTNEFGPLQMDANGYLKVEVFDGGGTHTVDAPIGTPVNVQIGNATLAAGVIDETGASAVDALAVGGGTAHDAVDSGNPLKMGGKAFDLGATPTAVAANDRVNAAFLRNGVQLVLGGNPNVITKNYQVTDADGAQTDADILGAVAAGTALVVTKISVAASAANTTNVSCRVGFGTANTPAADAAGVVLFHPGIAPGSGIVEGAGSGIIGVGASDQELRVTCDDPVTGSISIIVTYFTIAIG